jgi:hypothetical protein
MKNLGMLTKGQFPGGLLGLLVGLVLVVSQASSASEKDLDQMIEESLSAEHELQKSIGQNLQRVQVKSRKEMPDFKKIAAESVAKSGSEKVAVESRFFHSRNKISHDAKDLEFKYQNRVSEEVLNSR